MSDTERTVLVRVEGRVQGVGYRAFVRDEALRRGVSGWVVNCSDGSVEAAFHGPGAALGEIIGRMRLGPPAATVTSLDVRSTDRAQTAAVPAGGLAF